MERFNKNGDYLSILLWIVFFCYASCMALIFQNVIVPNMPSMADGGKLLSNDAVYFDSVAWALAEEIRAYGWERWSLFVNPSATGNVGILAALYALFGHDPSLAVPINAGLHALGGVLIFFLAKELVPNSNIGIFAGVITATLFVVFPSALNWYGQIHKDGYAIAGTLMMLLVWLKVLKTPKHSRSWVCYGILSLIGIALIGIVRPYSLTLLFVVTLGALLFVMLSNGGEDRLKNTTKQFAFFFVTLVILFGAISITKGYANQVDIKSQVKVESGWQWQDSEWVPDKLEGYISAAAKTRATLIHHGMLVNAGSTVDEDIAPQNVEEVIKYLPRALVVAMAAPFPSSWLRDLNMVWLVATLEMLIYYLCIPGVLMFLFYNNKPKTWMTVYFSSAFLTIFGFTIANMGTLFRVRYAYLFVFLLLGVLGWLMFLERKGVLRKIIAFFKKKSVISLKKVLFSNEIKTGRLQAVNSSVTVMLLTFIGFIGFFYRDILMAHTFGASAELDSFFIALLVPMTIVAILSYPIGAAFTPMFITMHETGEKREVQKLISGIAGAALSLLGVISITVYFSLPNLLPYVVDESVVENMENILLLTILSLSLLFFSGIVILGNAVLNAMGKFVTVGFIQLIVPLTAIMSVVLLADAYGVIVVMLGMVIGQLMNLLLISFNMQKVGYSLRPSFISFDSERFKEIVLQYLPLVVSAFFVSIAVFVNTILAATLPEGGVSIFNLGNKFVLIVTGLIGAGISTVMLPYFSTLIANNQMVTARRELSVFLLLLTFLFVPVSVVLFIWAEPIVSLLLKGGDFGSDDVVQVARVLKYAAIQIPIFAGNVLLLKFATSTKHVKAILFSAFVGLLINVAASMLFMKYMGVAGIALGASLSMIVATMLLVIILARYRHITLLDVVTLLLNWLLFITLLISINFGSVVGIIVTVMTYCILLVGYIKSLSSEHLPVSVETTAMMKVG